MANKTNKNVAKIVLTLLEIIDKLCISIGIII